MPRDFVQNVFDRKHALRPAEAAKRGIGHRIGLAAVRGDHDVFQEVAVVGMKHRAVVHWSRKIRREAAARSQRQLQPTHAALIVEADFVVVAESVPFAGHDHVVVTVDA